MRALRAAPSPPLPPVLDRGDLASTPARRSASRAGRPLDLSPRSSAYSKLLLAAQGAGRLGRGTAGEGVGRERRPVHERGQGHDQPAAPQARRPAGHRDRAQVPATGSEADVTAARPPRRAPPTAAVPAACARTRAAPAHAALRRLVPGLGRRACWPSRTSWSPGSDRGRFVCDQRTRHPAAPAASAVAEGQPGLALALAPGAAGRRHAPTPAMNDCSSRRRRGSPTPWTSCSSSPASRSASWRWPRWAWAG